MGAAGGEDLQPGHGVDIKQVTLTRTGEKLSASWEFFSIKDTGEVYTSLEQIAAAGRDTLLLSLQFSSLDGSTEGSVDATHQSGGSWELSYTLRGTGATQGAISGGTLTLDRSSAEIAFPASLSPALATDFRWKVATVFGVITRDVCPAGAGIGDYLTTSLG